MRKIKFGVYNSWHINYCGTPNKHNQMRYGQFFLEYFYDTIKGDGPAFSDPDLFYEKDKHKAYNMILEKYVEI